MRLSIHIELGNNAMQSGNDIARTLRELADHFAGYEDQGVRAPWTPPHTIRDINGNVVGKATVDTDPDDADPTED